MKYLIYIPVYIFIVLTLQIDVFAVPDIECSGLPGCDGWVSSETNIYGIIWSIIALLIKYVAVFAVLAVMYGGILYLISSGDEEKTKKARTVIIWALVGTFLSVSAWTLINILNRIVI